MSHWRVLALGVQAVTATIVVAACGGGGGGEATPTPDVQATETAAAEQEGAAAATAEAKAVDATATAEAFAPAATATSEALSLAATATAEAERQGSVGLSRDNPIPLGQPVTVPAGLEVKVIDVNPDAWPVVQAENMFNEPPQAGMRMVLVTLEVTHAGLTEETLQAAWDVSWGMVGSRNVVYKTYDPSCGVIPDDLQGELFPGGSIQGNQCFQAGIDESNLLLIVESGFIDEERRYFALQ